MKHVESFELSELKRWGLVGGWGEEHPDEYNFSEKLSPSESDYQRFSTIEQKVLRNAHRKLTKVLKRSPYKFNIFFVRRTKEQNLRDKSAWHSLARKEGQISEREVFRILQSENVDVGSLDWKRSINFLMFGTQKAAASGGNLPPTAWIVLHWMAHAFTAGMFGKKQDKGSEDSNFKNSGVYEILGELVKDSYKGGDVYSERELDLVTTALSYGKKTPVYQRDIGDFGRSIGSVRVDDRKLYDKLTSGVIRSDWFLSKTFFPKVLTFGSARRNRINNVTEGLQEIFAQYIWTGGGVKLAADPPAKIVDPKYDWDRETLTLVKISNADRAFDRAESKLKAYFKRIMDNAVGKWHFT